MRPLSARPTLAWVRMQDGSYRASCQAEYAIIRSALFGGGWRLWINDLNHPSEHFARLDQAKGRAFRHAVTVAESAQAAAALNALAEGR